MPRPVSSCTAPKISVVIATLNRQASLARLLRQLDAQTLDPAAFETIVVDDGSTEPVGQTVGLSGFRSSITVLRTERVGAAAARHAGIARARGEVIVILDDDIQVRPDFLAAHLEMHPSGSRNVVLGWIRPDPAAQLPVFERFHAEVLERFGDDVRNGRVALQGTHVATGNVSFPRADYLTIGGFDPSLPHSEDAELGVRLQKAGVTLTFSNRATVVHSSDRASLAAWRRRAFVYGVCDRRIARKHPDVPSADPWRYLSEVHPLSRPLLAAAVVVPSMMALVARATMLAAFCADRLGARRLGLRATTLAYGIEYFRGVRHASGTLRNAVTEYRQSAARRREAAVTTAVRHAC